MLSTRNLQKQSIKTLYTLIHHPKPTNYTNPFQKNPQNVLNHKKGSIFDTFFSNKYEMGMNWEDKKWMSTARGRSMRSRVERRMEKEAGRSLKQIRQAKKLKFKLMTPEERMLHSLRKAKKKVSVLLQRLKKYDLPELPQPRHDPELLTAEQLQAFKKTGFKNKNYAQVGVRGVFGGVVLNMHMHWKFHETVQILCDNYPKEKIKDMATILARLSGGIVINIHNVKTIIMYRGRNYRQPKLMTPLNTLTKRKALFKARFEQALESQKLNIKKIEQQLRRQGISPDDPVAMASIQRVASTFFNAIDDKEGSPYVFRGNNESDGKIENVSLQSDPGEDSDQEELDKFIAEIEDAADKEFEQEEAAEQEDAYRIRYLNKDGSSGGFRPDQSMHDDFDGDARGRASGFRDTYQRKRRDDSESEDDSDDGGNDASNDESLSRDSGRPRVERRDRGERRENPSFNHTNDTLKGNVSEEESGPEEMLGEIDDVMWNSDREEENPSTAPRIPKSEERGGRNYREEKSNRESDSDYSDQSDVEEGFSESEFPVFEEDVTVESGPMAGADEDYGGIGEAPFYPSENEDGPSRGHRGSKKNDEVWDSDCD